MIGRRTARSGAWLAACLVAEGSGAAQSTPFVEDGDPQQTGRSDRTGPRTQPVERWRFRTARRIARPPRMLDADTIALAGVDGTLHAVDARGIERWSFAAGGPMLASLAVTDGAVFFANDAGTLGCAAFPGTPRWTLDLHAAADGGVTVAGAHVYFAADDLVSIGRDGVLAWSTALGSHAFAPPSVARDGRTVYIADLNGALHMVRAADGSEVRRVAVGAPVFASVLVLPDGALVTAGRDGRIRAWEADGAPRWSVSTQDQAAAAPALGADGTVVAGSDDGALRAIDARTGRVVWTVQTSGRVRAQPLVDREGWVYAGSEDDRVYAIRPDGTVAWSYMVGADVDARPLLTRWGDLCVGADDAALHCLAPSPH